MENKKTATQRAKERTQQIENMVNDYADGCIIYKVSEPDEHHIIVIADVNISLDKVYLLCNELQTIDLSVDVAISTKAVYIQVW